MEIKEKKIIDMLTEESVCIITEKYVDVDGIETQVGERNRCVYSNDDEGRNLLENTEPLDVINAIYAIWGE